MLRTNLSTRPFYNERGVRWVLFAAAAIVALLTAFNLTEIVILTRHQTELSGRTRSASEQAKELRAHAVQVKQQIDPKQLDAIAVAAREANSVIGQRLFSWTDLLNQLETTLPDQVRITSMRPRVEQDGSITMVISASGRSVEDIEQFMDNLENTPEFENVLIGDEVTSDEGLIQVTMQGRYR
jgi:Tfp pilus assembly protein PilN